MAPEIQKSDIVLSQSGRDQGRMMVVLDTDADYLLLADGRLRRVESRSAKSESMCGLYPMARRNWPAACAKGRNCQTVMSAGRCRNGSSPRLQNDRGGNFVWQKKI